MQKCVIFTPPRISLGFLRHLAENNVLYPFARPGLSENSQTFARGAAHGRGNPTRNHPHPEGTRPETSPTRGNPTGNLPHPGESPRAKRAWGFVGTCELQKAKIDIHGFDFRKTVHLKNSVEKKIHLFSKARTDLWIFLGYHLPGHRATIGSPANTSNCPP